MGSTPGVALASVRGIPQLMSIRFKLPRAKKPIDRLSGDQNGSGPVQPHELRVLLIELDADGEVGSVVLPIADNGIPAEFNIS